MRRTALRFSLRIACLVCLGSPWLEFRLRGGDPAVDPADELWEELRAARQSFHASRPDSLEPEAFNRFLGEHAEGAGRLADRFKDYQSRFPASAHATQAWEDWMNLLDTAAHGSSARRIELETAEQQWLAHPKLGSRQRSTIRERQLDRIEDLAERERRVRQLKGEAEEPTDFIGRRMLDLAEAVEFPHSRDLVGEVLQLTGSTPTAEEYRATRHASTNVAAFHAWMAGERSIRERHHRRALELKRRLDRIGQPLRLQFTALDGTRIDLDRYRGKVVLLDFWATWCPPCVGALPGVKDVWKRLQPEGFEVIGVSYDDQRETLDRFLQKHELPWPQFFDPAGTDAPLIQSLGQPGPPAYWLIDRQGVLSDVTAHRDLERKARRLLASPRDPSPSTPAPTR